MCSLLIALSVIAAPYYYPVILPVRLPDAPNEWPCTKCVKAYPQSNSTAHVAQKEEEGEPSVCRDGFNRGTAECDTL